MLYGIDCATACDAAIINARPANVLSALLVIPFAPSWQLPALQGHTRHAAKS